MATTMQIILRLKPFLLVTFLQLGFAGLDLLSKAALNKGMSSYTFTVYRHAIATIVIAPFAILLERKRPKMTCYIFLKIVLLSLLEPVIGQNLYSLGMKYTTATFAAAMSNVLPAATFLIACVFKLEKFKIQSIYSHAKLLGTIATVAGALIMTLVTGPSIYLPWTKTGTLDEHSLHPTIKGSIMITIGCSAWACFVILQAITLGNYPSELSLTALVCFLGAFEGAAVALYMEMGNPTAWAVKWDINLVAAIYSGIFCTGIAYYIQGLVMKDKGPVFVTASSPLCTIIVAVLGSFILSEQLFLGRLVGAIIIIFGLYSIVWGKKKDEVEEKEERDEEERDEGSQTYSEWGSIDKSNRNYF